MERLVHLPFVHTPFLPFSLSASLSLSILLPLRSPATFRLSPFSPRPLRLLLFSLNQPSYPEGVFYASWTPGLAGRQSQLRSCFKVGARTKYGSISSYEYFSFFLPDTPLLLPPFPSESPKLFLHCQPRRPYFQPLDIG